MKTVILHVGTPKTGTTYIQNKLALNRQYVSEKYGIRYHSIPGKQSICHWWFATQFFDSPSLYSPVQAALQLGSTPEKEVELSRLSFDSLKKELEEFELVFISAEQFFFLPNIVLERIQSELVNLGVNIVIKIFVREPFDLAISEVNQKVKMGQSKLTDYNEKLPNFFLKKNIVKFVDIFGKSNVNVFNYTNVDRSKLISTLFDGVDFKGLQNPKKPEDSNKSLSMEALKVIDYVNEVFPKLPRKSPDRFALIGALSALGLEQYKPNEVAFNKLKSSTASDIKYLKDEWGVEFS